MAFTLERLYIDCGLDFNSKDLEGLFFYGETQDLEEVLGNLLENAYKWARSQVRIVGKKTDGCLVIQIEDDGPGIPEAMRSEVIKRGRRLDERKPGSGLGLAIVVNIVELYQGKIKLDTSSLGGLSIRLEFPVKHYI